MEKLKEFRRQAKLMGSAFEFVIVAEQNLGESLIQEAIEEVKRIEFLLTEFSETSFTSKINKAAGKEPVQVNDEVYSMIFRCKEISRLTQGAFDITSGILKKLYNFKGEEFAMAGRDQIGKLLGKVGYDKIHLLKDNYVYLTIPGMHIGFGAVGKGYAADRVKQILLKKGVTSGVINASGDLTAWGTRLDGTAWKVGIADPVYPSQAMLWLPVENASVATSGDYEQFFIYNGVRYAHTINPKSGIPVSGVKSVTVVSSKAELSDALATALFVMGTEIGMHFIEQLPQVYALIINQSNEVFMSKHLKLINNEIPVR